jgi:transposase
MSNRRRYSDEFKKEAVELLKSSNKKSQEIADELGIPVNNLIRWRREFEDIERETRVHKINPDDSEELKKLKKENDILRQEREILKKALGIFSKPGK